ncbi:MAG: GNAT family N-acetyltransferase [Desulfobacterales bacterium]|nr:GNAT family N-acetyltransferase [Desulfobacterales bacterium]
MKIAVLHQAVCENGSADDLDVLTQVKAVSAALESLGHKPEPVACGLDLSQISRTLEAAGTELVFNLVESLGGHGRLLHLVPGLLDALKIPYTGACAEALRLTSDKIAAKERMALAGLPTPRWIGPFPAQMPVLTAIGFGRQNEESVWIIKSVWEHASLGIDETSLIPGNAKAAAAEAAKRASFLGGAAFAERYVEGREFNLGLLQEGASVCALPPVEILFEGYGENRPRIVDYRAKWDEASFEYRHTPRCFEFESKDAALLAELKCLALRCWEVFGLKGYARVDFRVDSNNRPWILEINANPCISPDAGFAAALLRAGISFERAVERIVSAAIHPPDTAFGFGPLGAGCRESADPEFLDSIVLETEPLPEDVGRVERLVGSTDFFYPPEIAVAGELVQERLEKGEQSGYHFLLARCGDRLAGYGAYGPIPCTVSSFDLYWIAVSPDFQNQGLGRFLMACIEEKIQQTGGTRIYAETSSRPQYAATRAFYLRCGYRIESVMTDFYAPGDGRITFCKAMQDVNFQG